MAFQSLFVFQVDEGVLLLPQSLSKVASELEGGASDRTGWPDADPRQTVLLANAPKGLAQDAARRGGKAWIAHYGNTRVDVGVDAPDGGLLLLNDVWHPWWRATVDGADAEIMRANVIFRAVELPPGKHTVRFTFEPLRGAWRELREKLRGR